MTFQGEQEGEVGWRNMRSRRRRMRNKRRLAGEVLRGLKGYLMTVKHLPVVGRGGNFDNECRGGV